MAFAIEFVDESDNRHITQTADGWEYHLEKYTKEEYIKMINEQNQKTQADLEYLAMMTEVELE